MRFHFLDLIGALQLKVGGFTSLMVSIIRCIVKKCGNESFFFLTYVSKMFSLRYNWMRNVVVKKAER